MHKYQEIDLTGCTELSAEFGAKEETVQELDSKKCLQVDSDSEQEGGIKTETQMKNVIKRNRSLKLGTFVLIELLYLGFGFLVGSRTETIKLKSTQLHSFLDYYIDTVQIKQSTLSFIAGLYQTAALVFPGAIVADVYASEWYYLLHNTMSNAVDKTNVDKVSRLTAGPIKRLEHLADRKRASRAFSLAIIVSILLIPLHAMMIGTVTITSSVSTTAIGTAQIPIGTLPALFTFDDPAENAQSILLAARDAYISIVADDPLDVVCLKINRLIIANAHPSLLSRIPFRMRLERCYTVYHCQSLLKQLLLRNADEFSYIAEVVRYNYSCQWVAPQFVGFKRDENKDNSITNSLWSVGDSGVILTVDTLASEPATLFSSLYGTWHNV